MVRSIFLLLIIAPISCVVAAPLPDSDAAKHIGEAVSLDCNAVNVYTSKAGNTFINCGAAYPNHVASVVIFSSSTAKVGDVKQYEGKHIVVHGVLKSYRGKPEIVLESATQIEGSR